MVNWIKWPKIHNVEAGKTLYADIINHCKSYKNFMEPGDKATSAHEVTHGANSEIRNSHNLLQEYMVVDEPFFSVSSTCKLPQRFMAEENKKTGKNKILHNVKYPIFGSINGFYVGDDKAVVIPEPAMRKRDTTSFIPGALRGMRYGTYVTGQQEWDSAPLYLYDEGVAYINEAWAQYELIKANEVDHKDRIIDGHVEFITYLVAVMMAADQKRILSSDLVEFSRWLLDRACSIYFLSQGVFPRFDQTDKFYKELQNGSSASAIRDFLKKKVSFVIPSSLVEPFKPDDFNLLG